MGCVGCSRIKLDRLKQRPYSFCFPFMTLGPLLYISTLGPLLYILYVNDYLDRVFNLDSKVIMYADDTVLLSHGTCVTDVISENQKLFDDYVQCRQ